MRIRRPVAALLALLTLTSPAAPPALAEAPRSGVTTHFSQGWPPRLLGTAKALAVETIRDSIHWPRVERMAGQFDFTPANSGHVDRACAAGMTVLLGLEPRNPIYDAGQSVWSAGGRAAFARFVAAIARRWPHCVVAVEIGNEINGKAGMIGPAAQDRIAAHVALLREVHQAVKPVAPDLALLGGSSNSVATGFQERLIRAGMLDWVDGIAIHPYRPEPEGVEREIARLRAAMQAAGRDKTIWATEFSREFPRQEDAPAYYLKMTALLEGAGVGDHFWYALADQPAFPTMGLVRADGSAKPGAGAFAFAARNLAPLDRAVRVDEGDPMLFHYRYGPDGTGAWHVVWGARRGLSVGGAEARAFAADGSALPLPREIGEAPVVITGAASVRPGPGRVLADSFYGFGQAPLEWFALRAGGALVPLGPVDWAWNLYLGSPAVPNVAVLPQGVGTTGVLGTVVRYRAERDGVLSVSACLLPGAVAGSARASIRRAGHELWSATLAQASASALLQVPAHAGDPIDLVLSPVGGAPARLRYRFRVTLDGGEPAPCPNGAS